MSVLAVLMVVIWFSIAYEKPHALIFAGTIVFLGMSARWVTHHREAIAGQMQTLVEQIAEKTTLAPKGAAETSGPRYLVAVRGGNPKLIAFALEEARAAHAELLFLFVRHLAVSALGPAHRPDVTRDFEAQQLFARLREQAAAAGVKAYFLYTEADNIAETIVDFAVTHGVDRVILGATKRGMLWRTMKGDVIQGVALRLPERTHLLIQA